MQKSISLVRFGGGYLLQYTLFLCILIERCKMDKLLEILKELKSDVDFTTEKSLIDNNVLDSFDIVQLVGQLNDAFDIEIGAADIIPENFNSADAMLAMINRLGE